MQLKKKPEIKLSMEVSEKEANLLKRIRQIDESGELLLIVETGKVKRIKYSTIYSFRAGKASMTIDELLELIRIKVPFGEATVLTRNGQPYAISATMNYDDLSDGL